MTLSSCLALFTVTLLATLSATLGQGLVIPRFRDRSGASGISQRRSFKYGGPTIADLDGDGWDDLILNEHTSGPLRIYRRNGPGSFSLLYEDIFVRDPHGISTFDFEGNGRQDVYVARGGSNGLRPNLPLIYSFTNGNPPFRVLPNTTLNLDQFLTRGRAARFVDLDLDGDQDLILTGRSVDGATPGPLSEVAYYRNDGPSGWTVFQNSLLFNAPCSTSLVLTDLNNDNIVDMICSERAVVGVFLGTGSFPEPFIDVSDTWLAGVTLPRARTFYDSMTEIDYNNDGYMDLYLTCGLNYTFTPCPDRLLRNTGEKFVDDSVTARLPTGGIHQVPAVGDFNLDGFEDILLPAYGTRSDVSRNLLLINNGDGTFTTVTTHGANVQASRGFRGAGAGSILTSGTGRLDVVLGYEGFGPGGPFKFYRNTTPKNGLKFLALDIRDIPQQNMFARGARVTVQVGNRTMIRRVGNDGGESQSFKRRVHFGLGLASEADTVVINYVGGKERTMFNVRAGFRGSPGQ